jgi:hypothetical protein
MSKTNKVLFSEEKINLIEYVNSSQLAKILGITNTTLSNWKIQSRIVPTIVDNSVCFFDQKTVRDLIKEVNTFGRPLPKEAAKEFSSSILRKKEVRKEYKYKRKDA